MGPSGAALRHVFSHREFAYLYDTSWLARRFFTGGTMPSHTLLPSLATELRLVMTGGTDYHGDRETYAEAHAQLWVPDEVAAALGVTGVQA